MGRTTETPTGGRQPLGQPQNRPRLTSLAAFDYIDAMKDDASNLTQSLTFRVTDEEAVRVKRLAEQQERKMAGMIRLIFRRGLKMLERAK